MDQKNKSSSVFQRVAFMIFFLIKNIEKGIDYYRFEPITHYPWEDFLRCWVITAVPRMLSNLHNLGFLKAELRKASRASSVWFLMYARQHVSTDDVCL